MTYVKELTPKPKTAINTETVALMAVALTWNSFSRTGKAGRYMFPANGPKKPATVTTARINTLLGADSAEYGGV
jgi:hypothetical protein